MDRPKLRAVENPHALTLRERVPLGPLAGATLQGWRTRSGKRVHLLRGCGDLEGRDELVEVDFEQPADGPVAKAVLPSRVHCLPEKGPGAYLRLVEELEAEEVQASQMEQDVRHEELLTLLTDHYSTAEAFDLDRFRGQPELLSIATEVRERQVAALDTGWRLLKQPRDRLAFMITGSWVDRGRTPREYRPNYERMLWAGAETLAAEFYQGLLNPISRAYDLIRTHELAQQWLQRLIATGSLDASAAALGDTTHVERAMVSALHGVWRTYVTGMVTANPGEVVVLFEEFGTALDHDLQNLALAACPSASAELAGQGVHAAVMPEVVRHAMRRQRSGQNGGPGFCVVAAANNFDNEATCEALLRWCLELLRRRAGPEPHASINFSDQVRGHGPYLRPAEALEGLMQARRSTHPSY